MNIYFIDPRPDCDYSPYTVDCYHSHIVRAETAARARALCPHADEGDVWTDTQVTRCRKIGEATPGTRQTEEVIQSNFRGG